VVPRIKGWEKKMKELAKLEQFHSRVVDQLRVRGGQNKDWANPATAIDELNDLCRYFT
jgi:hypothetical protein